MEQVPFIICAVVNEMEEFTYLLKTNELADIIRSYWDDQEKPSFISYLSKNLVMSLNPTNMCSLR